ncbi:MAG: hypothetical protein ACYCXZ_06490 [Coriobacteriia bacterium]
MMRTDRPEPWSSEDLKLLRESAHLGKAACARILDRSESAIMNKATQLGLSLKIREPEVSAGSVSESQPAVESTPEPDVEPERAFEHCEHVQRCVVTGITECGADPCNLVTDLIDTRCDDRTPASCAEDPCHDCGIYPKPVEQVGDGRATGVVNLVIDGGDKYRLEAIHFAARLAIAQIQNHDFFDEAETVDVLDRIKELAS